jgi:hypothetical protein
MTVDRFEDLDCWQVARGLTNAVYSATESGACSRDYGFVDQARRAALSVMNNIAEGFERDTNRDFVKCKGFRSPATTSTSKDVTCNSFNVQRFQRSTCNAFNVQRLNRAHV